MISFIVTGEKRGGIQEWKCGLKYIPQWCFGLICMMKLVPFLPQSIQSALTIFEAVSLRSPGIISQLSPRCYQLLLDVILSLLPSVLPAKLHYCTFRHIMDKGALGRWNYHCIYQQVYAYSLITFFEYFSVLTNDKWQCSSVFMWCTGKAEGYLSFYPFPRCLYSLQYLQ